MTTSGPSKSRKRAVAGLEIVESPYLGPVYEADDGLIQLIEPGKILEGRTVASLEPGGGAAS